MILLPCIYYDCHGYSNIGSALEDKIKCLISTWIEDGALVTTEQIWMLLLTVPYCLQLLTKRNWKPEKVQAMVCFTLYYFISSMIMLNYNYSSIIWEK